MSKNQRIYFTINSEKITYNRKSYKKFSIIPVLKEHSERLKHCTHGEIAVQVSRISNTGELIFVEFKNVLKRGYIDILTHDFNSLTTLLEIINMANLFDISLKCDYPNIHKYVANKSQSFLSETNISLTFRRCLILLQLKTGIIFYNRIYHLSYYYDHYENAMNELTNEELSILDNINNFEIEQYFKYPDIKDFKNFILMNRYGNQTQKIEKIKKLIKGFKNINNEIIKIDNRINVMKYVSNAIYDLKDLGYLIEFIETNFTNIESHCTKLINPTGLKISDECKKKIITSLYTTGRYIINNFIDFTQYVLCILNSIIFNESLLIEPEQMLKSILFFENDLAVQNNIKNVISSDWDFFVSLVMYIHSTHYNEYTLRVTLANIDKYRECNISGETLAILYKLHRYDAMKYLKNQVQKNQFYSYLENEIGKLTKVAVKNY